jgi:4-amino-4-deoxy-L-arabinose transferase-like glycosyltransferase
MWLILMCAGLAVGVVGSRWIRTPGYMDADYYYAISLQLTSGEGFQEPFIWNYLSGPAGIPHPSNLYWMPLTSIISAIPMVLLGESFRVAQAPMIFLFALLPILTAAISLWLYGKRDLAFFSGLLAIFPGFYLPYFLTTDMFILYSLLGSSAIFLSAMGAKKGSTRYFLAAGFLVGLANLARTDGFLLLLPVIAGGWWMHGRRAPSIALAMLGFLAAMAPWWAMMTYTTGFPFAAGSTRGLWLRSYPELFTYPAELLTPLRWLDTGWSEIIGARISASMTNLQRALGENGLIFLSPLMIAGGWKLRRNLLVRQTAIYLGLLFIVMSFVFPFAGANGGFFHSSAAVMPILWALAPMGLKDLVDWWGEKRGWDLERSHTLFRNTAVVMACLFTLATYWNRVSGPGAAGSRWNSSNMTYQRVGELLEGARDLVAVNNPPGFYVATRMPAVVIPNGDGSILRSVVEAYGVGWVVLDANRPAALAALYDNPDSLPWLELHSSTIDPSTQGPIYVLKVTSADR